MKKSFWLGLVAALTLSLVPFAGASATGYNGTTVEAEADNITYEVTALAGDTVTLANIGSTTASVAITFKNNVDGTIVITESASRPSDATSDPSGIVSLYYDIKLVGLTNADVSGAVLTFTVPKTWLSANGFTGANIFLQHFDGSGWVKLTTKEVASTDTTITFTGTITSFSPFSITGVAGLSNTGSPYMLGAILSISALAIIIGSFVLSKKRHHNN